MVQLIDARASQHRAVVPTCGSEAKDGRVPNATPTTPTSTLTAMADAMLTAAMRTVQMLYSPFEQSSVVGLKGGDSAVSLVFVMLFVFVTPWKSMTVIGLALASTRSAAMGIVQMAYSHFEQFLVTGLLC